MSGVSSSDPSQLALFWGCRSLPPSVFIFWGLGR